MYKKITHIPPIPKKTLVFLITAVLVTVLDQVTKYIILVHVPRWNVIPVIHGFFNIVHVENPGGAFGMLATQGPGLRAFVFIFITLLAMGLVFYLHARTPGRFMFLIIGLAMIFGGAAGNFIDRIRFGRVIDFIDIYAGAWHWPAFNVADSCITLGMIIYGYHILFDKGT
ncbi:MAG: signal peptidase II [Deltaproteobacteria bacterium]|nr:signal peptidase II [Deltaproteobacteria bacterium]